MDNRILELLEQQTEGYLSGEVLSKDLHISRTAVWKHIKKLEAQGYKFEASRRLGYRLISKPSKLSIQELMEKLSGTSLIKAIKLHESVDSTQNIAQRLAEDDAPQGTLVIAEQQTSGRGRMGRKWVSPSGKGIWMSLVLRPRLPLQFASQLTLLTAVALCRALKTVAAPLDIGIKWPNDLLIGGKKISGILLESTAEDERLKYVIAGIGISVNLEADDYPEELLPIATSLRMELGRPLDRADIIAAFIIEFEQLYNVYQNEGFGLIRTVWEALSVSLFKPTQLKTPTGIVVGTPIGLDESGALLVKLEDGSLLPIFSAEMSPLSDNRS
ncbi:bifunctional ligase/repressor BirA [Paenibacillus baekrokdamisoli]|uniref:Bifunctional ligase/repressor BirA n=1 Tax=Paenibacillus baekrokdamisoli TaxID=1712516 RepID=A0A3G9IQ08_9BACL|nr:biotin--[acetyl-CoA-carboxylase] ligase [Paenibacillus baekrokdamisoli]MBB3069689.1 BirA family biotin operon repressor/biotin-[acetyl-CoA-carboxylase] ligase [Paenibacillus baekrokdamisoli]BBH20957.1 bifunctional ligase/repressor BirA [Paenibacillus baekrokdamisoli]